ncbi:MAG TPA: TraB/GumN family protein, partial [Chitinophagaceae bacterium]
MKKLVLYFLFSFSALLTVAQVTPAGKRYPSLFWQITGNGLTKPSYLFGTMHVSSKMAFHLPDSFYFAMKGVDVVALETNPESWQEDLVRYDLGDNGGFGGNAESWSLYKNVPNDYLNIRSLQVQPYERLLAAALYSKPSTINNLLYRNYSEATSDFEENTYLDMYIYQVGKKMGKRVAGVERYDESMRLMIEAYRDALKDRRKSQSRGENGEEYSPDRLQDAYRAGNLDLLDSINHLNSFSQAFDEKFLYRRNILQASSIDSIIKSGAALFVGVGAAHLPGTRGVIELLRRKGYSLRPIVMGERDGAQKDIVEHLRVPVIFAKRIADDREYEVEVPGSFYRFSDESGLDQLQYADMANGSYYMVTRVRTNAALLHENESETIRKVDSLLYENIPGQII